jgi:DNA-directed RNA polymerase III subunit RPC1
MDTINALHLDIQYPDIADAIVAQKKLKITHSDIKQINGKVRIYVADSSGKMGKGKDEADVYARVISLKRIVPGIAVTGHPETTRAVIQKIEPTAAEKRQREDNVEAERKRKGEPAELARLAAMTAAEIKEEEDNATIQAEIEKKKAERHRLVVEGYGLRACMNTTGVLGTCTSTNSVIEMRDVLGIEAARGSIIREISSVMGEMNIDPRHMQLLADVMTFKGEILGITRFGLAKMRDSVLQLASFEKTPDHLFDAAFRMKRDRIEGVSECIIMGQSMSVGTGAFQVVRKMDEETGQGMGCGRKEGGFESVWREVYGDGKR